MNLTGLYLFSLDGATFHAILETSDYLFIKGDLKNLTSVRNLHNKQKKKKEKKKKNNLIIISILSFIQKQT